MTSMAARLRDLEQKHRVYQCELKEMHDKYRQANDMFQKARKQNEEHENTIVTLYEAKQDLESELTDVKAFLLAKCGIRWEKGMGSSRAGMASTAAEPVQSSAPSDSKEPPTSTNYEGKAAAPSSFGLYDGDCAVDTLMDEEMAEAVLAASGPRIFPNSAKQKGVQLYSRRRKEQAGPHSTAQAPAAQSGPPERSSPTPAIDMELLQRNARILSDYVGWKHVVTDGSKGRIRDRDVVRAVIYKNGICVNNGPFRPFGWPLCEAFLQDVAEGYYPYEFKEKYPDGFPIEITDKREEECDPLKATTSNTAEGGGHRVGGENAWDNDGGYQPVSREQFLNKLPEKRISPSGRVVDVRETIASLIGAPTTENKKTTAPHNTSGPLHHVSKSEQQQQQGKEAPPPPPPSEDAKAGAAKRPPGWVASTTTTDVNSSSSSSPKTTSPSTEGSLVPLIIRMPSGQQVSMQLSPSDTIEMLRKEFTTAVPEFAECRFEFCQAYPPKTFTEHKKTLREYNLVKSSALLVRVLK